MELLQGPLLNPRRLEESIKSKFVKRLIGFYRPTSQRFSEIEKNPVIIFDEIFFFID
jgi:rapamycin-insensitive companion of mTOR